VVLKKLDRTQQSRTVNSKFDLVVSNAVQDLIKAGPKQLCLPFASKISIFKNLGPVTCHDGVNFCSDVLIVCLECSAPLDFAFAAVCQGLPSP
jgi:hypothetical protein